MRRSSPKPNISSLDLVPLVLLGLWPVLGPVLLVWLWLGLGLRLMLRLRLGLWMGIVWPWMGILVLVLRLGPGQVQGMWQELGLGPGQELGLVLGSVLVVVWVLGPGLGLEERLSNLFKRRKSVAPATIMSVGYLQQSNPARLADKVATTLVQLLPSCFSLEDRTGITVVICDTCQEAYEKGGGWGFRGTFTKEICGLLWLLVYSHLVRGKKYASR